MFNNFITFSVISPFLVMGSIIAAIFLVALFFLRGVFCWYLKINEIKKVQKNILDNLQEMHELIKGESISSQFLNFETLPKSNIADKFQTEDELIIHLFNTCKNLAVYNISPNDENVFTYFQAKQYKIIPINSQSIQFSDLRTYQTLMSVEDKIDILVVRTGTKNIANVLNESIARKKVKNDIEYIWLEDAFYDEKILNKFRGAVKIINGQNIYKKYVTLMLKTTICNS